MIDWRPCATGGWHSHPRSSLAIVGLATRLMTHIRQQHQGTLLVEGKSTYSFTLADGRRVKGHDLIENQWPWRDHPGSHGCTTYGYGPRAPPMAQ